MCFYFPVAGLLIALTGTNLQLQPANGSDEIGIVLVVSKTTIDALVQDEVEIKIPIKRDVQGIPVTGEAVGRGIPRVDFVPSSDSGRFMVIVDGTAEGHVSSTVGPATVHFSTIATFHSEKQVAFNGVNFFGLPTQTRNCNQTKIDQICSRPRRLAGRLVRRVAGCVARRNKCEIDHEMVIATRELINETFDEISENLVSSLDVSFPFGDLIRKHFPETEDWTFSLITRSDSIVTGIGPPDARLSAEFREGREHELLGDQPPALAEIWLKTTPGQAAMLQLVADWDLAYDVLRDKVDPAIANLLVGEVKLVNITGWSVLRVGIESVPK